MTDRHVISTSYIYTYINTYFYPKNDVLFFAIRVIGIFLSKCQIDAVNPYAASIFEEKHFLTHPGKN